MRRAENFEQLAQRCQRRCNRINYIRAPHSETAASLQTHQRFMLLAVLIKYNEDTVKFKTAYYFELSSSLSSAY
jgi:hypothetical protein